MTRRKKIYEGKAKILYEGPEPGTLIQYFKDDTTAFDATKKAVLEGKGVINNRISEYIMTKLNSIGVQNHFIKRLNLREQLIKEVEIIPLEVVCRNVAAGSLSTRYGLPEGQALPRSIIADSCRLWDAITNEKLDKDRFRRDLGNVIESYTEVARRLGIMKEMPTVIQGGLH